MKKIIELTTNEAELITVALNKFAEDTRAQSTTIHAEIIKTQEEEKEFVRLQRLEKRCIDLEEYIRQSRVS